MAKMLLRLLAAALCLATSNALYADQAGEFDWNTENVGRVQAVAFGGSVSRGPHSVVSRGTTRAVYVASDERSRALARLDSKTGEIQWRRVFVEGDAINDIQLTNYGLLSVSGNGRNVRLWDLNTGVLLWDEVTNKGPAPKDAVFGGLFSLDGDHSVVLTSSSVAMVGVRDGQVKVQTLPEDFTKAAVDAAELSWQVGSDNTALFVMAGNQMLEYELASGRAVNQFKRPEIKEADKGDVQATTVLRRDSEEGKTAAVTLTKDQLLLQGLENKKDSSEVALKSLKLDGDKVVAIDASISNSLVLVLASGKRAILKITSALKVEVAAIVAAEGALMESVTNDAVLFHAAAKSTDSKAQMTSYTVDKSLTPVSWEAELDLASFGGDVSRAFVGCPNTKKDSVPTCHAVLVLKDDALIMTSNEEEADANNTNVQWVREESLANIKRVRWVTPAETEIEKQALKRIPSFMEELELEMKHLQQLVEKVKTLFDETSRQRGVDRSRAARKEPPNAHLFGFSKYIMALTTSGKLFAIRAEASTVAWSAFVGPEYQLFVTRDHPALGSGAELLLVSNSTELVWLDGDDGHQVDKASAVAASGASWVVVLPKRRHLTTDEEPTARRTVAVISESSLKVSLYPKETADFAHPELNHFYFYRYDETSKVLRGYFLENEGDAKITDYRAREAWSIVLPREQQVIATSHHHDHSVVDSAVTITGDDSLLIKYLNPNLFGLATIATEPSEGDSEAASVLRVSLIDTVAGRIIHRARHPHATGPVRMVQSENWLVYSYWNSKEKRTEMVSLSLFDGAVGMHSLNPWKRPSWTSTRSSFDSKAPFVLQKSFIYPTKITSLGVTVTAHGITPQSVLVGMETGQIFKLARNFIDPRQPEKPLTPEEQAEGLMMYSPLVPVYNRPQAMLTYNRTVENLNSISTAAAELESTTLVFAHGLDMFYVRMTPAKSFDLLPSDFNHEMLILLCLTFLAVTFGTKALAQRKALQSAWK
ncbi:ER membrane protein complex subunit 1 [Phytophthora infestans]|uniref:ER membrane protein complex subunit 1 n=1 Tax=Phytophthora infestans TaxID=4787 RepID=A0A833SWQ0_PHYIN|nr:ER membrane protein complex subunit 1 [Phytophthora infestans]KAF4147323.1 ER membrane protein complex subunit 1 C-terminal [Phytophthora infestans]